MDDRFKIHSFYIVGILVAIIITLVTVEWSRVPNLVDYLVSVAKPQFLESQGSVDWPKRFGDYLQKGFQLAN